VRLLTGIYKPTSGEVDVLGVHPKNFNARMRSRIGYMPQQFVLYPDLTILENLNFAASLYGLGVFNRIKRINKMLDFVELKEHKNKLTRKLSGGMQRRLSLAATLIHDPEVIFLDEPTAGIDPILREKFWDRFRDLQTEGRTLFITTQYVGEAAYCDYIVVMANGQLLMVDTPQGLRRRAFGGEVIDVQSKAPLTWEEVRQLNNLPYLKRKGIDLGNNSFRVIVDDTSVALPALLEWFQSRNIEIESAKEFLPPFDDVFVILVREGSKNV
jgi:ABC-2 type transport system ATP-binding protein